MCSPSPLEERASMLPAPRRNSSQRSLLVLTSLLGKAADTGAHSSAKSTRVPCSQPLCADTHITSPPELPQLQVSFSTRAHLAASLQLQGQKHPLTRMGDQMGCMVSRTHLWLQIFGPPSERCCTARTGKEIYGKSSHQSC